jgi:hypothetical protein
MFTQNKTISPDNRFSFTCPIFGVNTEIRVCLFLREQLWRGKKQTVRKGCQACLHDSKCPIYPIMREMQSKDVDPYYSPTPKHGALYERHLSSIRNIVVRKATLDRYDVPENERKLIQEVSIFGAKLKGKALVGDKEIELPTVSASEAVEPSRSAKRQKRESVAVSQPTLVDAAITGDLAAAVVVTEGDTINDQ